MSGSFRLLAGCALAMALCAPAYGAERCVTGPAIEGKYTIDAQGTAVKSSERIKLVAVCGYRKDKALGGVGAFRFQGNAEVSGTLRRDVSDSLGEALWFTPDAASVGELAQPSIMSNDIRVSENPKARKLLPLPGDADCRSAPARLRILGYEYVAGPGTDNDGPFLLDYEIISVGKAKQCEFKQ